MSGPRSRTPPEALLRESTTEARLRADLDAALAAVKESNRLLMQSIVSRDSKAMEKRLIKLRASRWKLVDVIRQCHRFESGQA